MLLYVLLLIICVIIINTFSNRLLGLEILLSTTSRDKHFQRLSLEMIGVLSTQIVSFLSSLFWVSWFCLPWFIVFTAKRICRRVLERYCLIWIRILDILLIITCSGVDAVVLKIGHLKKRFLVIDLRQYLVELGVFGAQGTMTPRAWTRGSGVHGWPYAPLRVLPGSWGKFWIQVIYNRWRE